MLDKIHHVSKYHEENKENCEEVINTMNAECITCFAWWRWQESGPPVPAQLCERPTVLFAHSYLVVEVAQGPSVVEWKSKF